ncbi:hypothetical protein [Halosegnis longus]|uniref:hypothetical protein n=1 Tax=Halosegnis longus TaxID=2216012 RepID=UPI00129D2439|nr:hypothetical protein [Halosegnis longus]
MSADAAGDPDYDLIAEELGLNSDSGPETHLRKCVTELREALARAAGRGEYEHTTASASRLVGYPAPVVGEALRAMAADAPDLLEHTDDGWRFMPPEEE